MRGLFFVVVISSVIGCASEDAKEASLRECRRLREHLIDLRLADTHVDVVAHRKALSGAMGDDFVNRCAEDLTTAQVRCALATKDSLKALECTRGTASSEN